MAYTSGLATDYRDLLDKLDKFLTNRHGSAIAINAAGTGYVVGDILSVADGTVEGGMTAQIEVLEVGGSGEITSARIFNSGAYSVDPTTTGTGVTGGTGTGATFDLTMAATGWTNRIRNISSAVDPIVAGPVQNISSGSGYVVGDVVTLNTPFVKTSEATYRVDAVNVNGDRKSTRLNSSHVRISYAVFCLKKKKKQPTSHPSLRKNKKNYTPTANHLLHPPMHKTSGILPGDCRTANYEPCRSVRVTHFVACV